MKMKVGLGGEEREVREEHFETIREDWNEYRLPGGGRVRIKVSVEKIFLVLDESGKPALTAQGDPHVAVRHKLQVVASTPGDNH